MSVEAVSRPKTPGDDLPGWDLRHLYDGRDSKVLKADLVEAGQNAKEFETRFKGHLNELSGEQLSAAIADY